MKPAVLLMVAAALLSAAGALRFDITDARGKKPAGVSLETSEPNEDGWFPLKVVTKGKGTPVLIWPFDGLAKAQDGPGEIPAIVMESADPKALTNKRLLVALAAGELLGTSHETGLDSAVLQKAFETLSSSEDPFQKGVEALREKKPAEAAELLSRALKERERQLTRVPSEIYPAAVLCGRALFEAGKFDEAAVAYLKALKLRPSDSAVQKARSEALVKAGKPEAQ